MAALTPEQVRAALVLVTTDAVIASSQFVSTNAAQSQAALLEAVPALVAYYSDGTSALAADYYDDLRADAGAPGRFSAEPVVNLREEKIRAGVLWAVQPLLLPESDPALSVARIGEVVQLETARPFRDTITTNRRRDPASVGWRRHASGGCKFCVMLADKGAIFKEATARFAAHENCHCTATPVFRGDDGPEASAIQYVASKRTRTAAEKKALRDHLNAMDGGPVTSPGSVGARAVQSKPTGALAGFNGLSKAQVQQQIRILDGLKDSEYRAAQLAKLQDRLASF